MDAISRQSLCELLGKLLIDCVKSSTLTRQQLEAFKTNALAACAYVQIDWPGDAILLKTSANSFYSQVKYRIEMEGFKILIKPDDPSIVLGLTELICNIQTMLNQVEESSVEAEPEQEPESHRPIEPSSYLQGYSQAQQALGYVAPSTFDNNRSETLAQDESIESEGPWSRPKGPKDWGKVFGFSADTFKRRCKDKVIRYKKLSCRKYLVHLDDLPTIVSTQAKSAQVSTTQHK